MAGVASAASESSAPTKKRHILVAAVLSLLCPGLGHLYNTQARRAFIWFATAFGASAIASLLLVVPPRNLALLVVVFVAVAVIVVLELVIIVDAALGARRIGSAKLEKYNRGYIYFGIILVLIALSLGWDAGLQRFKAQQSYSIPSASSAPALVPGDYVMASRNHYRDREPERGDLIVFKLPRDNETDYVKRLVGLPGDRIQMRKGRLFINGEMVERELITNRETSKPADYERQFSEYLETLPGARSYVIHEEGDDSHYDNTREYLVPEGHYFLLGDNRDRSEDGRGTVGFVPRANLRDYPVIIYWSKDLDRIGTLVQPAP